MKQTILSSKQSEILETLIVKYGQVVTARQIHQEVDHLMGYQQTKNLILKLTRNGWLVRIKRGIYTISDLSSRGSITLSPLVIANLIEPESYVSFEAALQQYGMFDQLPNKILSVSLKMHKTVHLAGMAYGYVKSKPSLYFGWQEMQTGSYPARLATPEKALIDMVNFHKSQASIDLVIEKLIEHDDDLDLDRLMDYVSRFSVTTIKTFGLIFDLLAINSDRLHCMINSKQGTAWMLPGAGKFNARWRLYYPEYFDKYIKG